MTDQQTDPHTDQRAFSTKLLVDLFLDPRDPGYEAAAKRRADHPDQPRTHWYDRPLLAIGCLLAGFVLAVAYAHTHRAAPETAKVHSALVDRVKTAETKTDALADDEQRLSRRVNAIRKAALGSDSALQGQVSTDQLQAGVTAVHGLGLTVTLTEPAASNTATAAPGRAPETPQSAGNILSDRDLRSVVNQLWSEGAEAIAVNGIRLTPVSAIRFAGEAVLVDLQPITSPYTVDAIGNANSLDTGFAESAVASRYQTLVGAKGIGFSFTEQADLSLPASSSATTLRYAAAGTGKHSR